MDSARHRDDTRWFVIPRTDLPVVGAPISVIVPCTTPPDDVAISSAQPTVPSRLEALRVPLVVRSRDELARLVAPAAEWANEIDFSQSMIVWFSETSVGDRITVYPPIPDAQRPRRAAVKDGVIAFATLPVATQRCWAIPPTRVQALASRRAVRPIPHSEMAWASNFEDTLLERAAGRYHLSQDADWLVFRAELIELPDRQCQERLATRVLTNRLDGGEPWDDRTYNLVVFTKTQPDSVRAALAMTKQGRGWTIDVPVPVAISGGCCHQTDCYMEHEGHELTPPVAQFEETFASGYLVPKAVTGPVRAMFQPVDKPASCSE